MNGTINDECIGFTDITVMFYISYSVIHVYILYDTTIQL
jgi:hypothetical protein